MFEADSLPRLELFDLWSQVSPEERVALRERFEASHPEFRELRANVRSAVTVLLIVGLGHIAVGGLLFLLDLHSDVPGKIAAPALAVVALGVLFLACAKSSRTNPVLAVSLALAVWVGTQAASAAIDPRSVLPLGFGAAASLFVRFVVLVLLLRGLHSALRAGRLEREVKRT